LRLCLSIVLLSDSDSDSSELTTHSHYHNHYRTSDTPSPGVVAQPSSAHLFSGILSRDLLSISLSEIGIAPFLSLVTLSQPCTTRDISSFNTNPKAHTPPGEFSYLCSSFILALLLLSPGWPSMLPSLSLPSSLSLSLPQSRRSLSPPSSRLVPTLAFLFLYHSSQVSTGVMAMGGDGDARGATQLKYNGTGATGANPLNMDVNIWYEVSLIFLPASHTPSASPFWSLFS
jgi:hypothetical protein